MTRFTADGLEIVETITADDGSTAEIHKHNHKTYSLVITSRHTGHCRFGTLAEIRADACHFRTFGKLPVSSGRRWF